VFVISVLLWWLLTLFLAGWWLTRPVVAEAVPVAPELPDPIVQTVEKWAHDWERGRA
jgi:hypothetical protein